jgi:hypothetical protein
MVNYLYFQIRNTDTDTVAYTNSWVTDKEITEENVERLAVCARARWKIENEHNNVLKTGAATLNTTSAMARTMPARFFPAQPDRLPVSHDSVPM